MKPWSTRALISLSIAVACAKATDEKLISSGEDDSGGTSGTGASPFGGASGFGGTTSGGTSGKGGTATGGATTGGATATGGKGGTTTTGGSDSGGASDGGEGGDDACTPAATVPDLRLDYQAAMKAVTDDMEGEFHVVNGTGDSIPLSDLTIRYWFHSEFPCADTTAQMMVNVVVFQIREPFEDAGTANVTKRVRDLGTGAPGCDAYFELGFTASAGSLEAEQVANVKYFAQIPIYTRPHDQSNDYSYGACTMAPFYFDRVTLYRDGRLVSGTPPGGGGGEGGAGGEGGGGMGGISP